MPASDRTDALHPRKPIFQAAIVTQSNRQFQACGLKMKGAARCLVPQD